MFLATSFHDRVWPEGRGWPALRPWLGDVPFAIAAMTPFALVLGFLPALAVLAATVAGVRRARRPPVSPRTYALACAGAGFAHALLGLALRFAFPPEWHPASISIPFVLAGGFLLTNARPGVAAAAVVAQPLAGALAGLVYARLVRPREDIRRGA